MFVGAGRRPVGFGLWATGFCVVFAWALVSEVFGGAGFGVFWALSFGLWAFVPSAGRGAYKIAANKRLCAQPTDNLSIRRSKAARAALLYD